MNNVINYLKVLLIPLGVILIFPLVLSILNLIGLRTHNLFILIMMIFTSLISGVMIGKKAFKKGYLSGLVLGLILISFLFLLGLFGSTNTSLHSVIYYLIIIICSIIGSMIGIQFKDHEEKKSPKWFFILI